MGRGLSWQQLSVLEDVQRAEAENGKGAALPLVGLARNWSFSYDDVQDRNRANRDTYVLGRRGILALEQRGLVTIRREPVPAERQPGLLGSGFRGRFKRLDMVRLTPAGQARYWLTPPSSVDAQTQARPDNRQSKEDIECLVEILADGLDEAERAAMLRLAEEADWGDWHGGLAR
jgi:hypothetical protein